MTQEELDRANEIKSELVQLEYDLRQIEKMKSKGVYLQTRENDIGDITLDNQVRDHVLSFIRSQYLQKIDQLKAEFDSL